MPSQISIHALLAESDYIPAGLALGIRQFLSTLSLRRATVWYMDPPRKRRFISIHALLAESDSCPRVSAPSTFLFLSTLSLRRATARPPLMQGKQAYFYPRSPCGERHDLRQICHDLCKISIHALLAESDDDVSRIEFVFKQFLSTLSLRRATTTYW